MGITWNMEDPDFFQRTARETHRRLVLVVRKVTLDIEANIKESMHEPKSGRIYGLEGRVTFYGKGGRTSFIANRGKTVGHRASAPGEAPAVDTGALEASIQAVLPKENSNPVRGEIQVGQDYGAPLEFGTTRMARRPFLGPATDKEEDNFFQAVETVVSGEY